MKLRPHRAGNASHPRLPRRTIRVRLALLFFAVFLAAGTVLLVVTFAIWQARTNALTRNARVQGGRTDHPGQLGRTSAPDRLGDRAGAHGRGVAR